MKRQCELSARGVKTGFETVSHRHGFYRELNEATCHKFPPPGEGEGVPPLHPNPESSRRVSPGSRAIAFDTTMLAIPAKAGIQGFQGLDALGKGKQFGRRPDVIWRIPDHWIPAFAGMTVLSAGRPDL